MSINRMCCNIGNQSQDDVLSLLFFLHSWMKAEALQSIHRKEQLRKKGKEWMCLPRPPAAITLPPRQPATKSALFSLILDVRLGLIQIPATGERTQGTVRLSQQKTKVSLPRHSQKYIYYIHYIYT